MATKQTYADNHWVTITIDHHSPNVQRFFRNSSEKERFYKKHPKGEKKQKIVIGCANWVEAAHIEANFENYVPYYDGLVIRKSSSQRKPNVDGRKFNVKYLSRNQAEKMFPALFKWPNKDLLEKAIKQEMVRRDSVTRPRGVETLPPKFERLAKALVSKVRVKDFADVSQYQQDKITKALIKSAGY